MVLRPKVIRSLADICPKAVRFLSDNHSISIREFMDDNSSFEDIQARVKELAGGYKFKLPRKLALLLPHKTQIQELLARRASYDDIRLLLAEAKIIVSKDTVHRFCRKVIGQKPVRQTIVCPRETSPAKVLPVLASPDTIQTTLREQRERAPGPWLRRKRGPRIADSKNL